MKINFFNPRLWVAGIERIRHANARTAGVASRACWTNPESRATGADWTADGPVRAFF